MKNLGTYGHAFCIKILYTLLNDKIFLQNVADILIPDYFETPAHKWIIETILRYYNKYHTTISMDALSIEVKKEKIELLGASVKEQLRQAYESTTEDIDYIKEEFFNFLKNQRMKDAILTSAEMLDNGGEFDDIFRLFHNVLKIQEKDGMHIYEEDVEQRYTEDNRNPVPFPWFPLTSRTQGGPGAGDLVILVSNPKGGKSWGCVAIGGYAAKLGLDVMHYSLELAESYTAKRYDAYLTGVDVDKLDNHKDLVAKTVAAIPGKIRIKKFPPGRTTLSVIENHLRKLKNNEGFEPKIVIIDYLEKLRNTKDRKDKLEDASDVFTDAKGLAEVLGVPIISPAQANRTASDIPIIKGQHLAGTFEKFMIADIIVSVSKCSDIWYIMGNRYGDDDIAFKSKFNRKNGHVTMENEEYDENSEELNDDTRESLKKKFMKLNNS